MEALRHLKGRKTRGRRGRLEREVKSEDKEGIGNN